MIALICKSDLFYDFIEAVLNGNSKKYATLTFLLKSDLERVLLRWRM